MKPAFTLSQDRVRLSSRRPVRLRRVAVGQPVQAHDHDFHEIFVATEGGGWHRCPDRSRPLAAGSVTFVAPGQVHAFDQPRGLKGYNLHYLSEWLVSDLSALWSEEGLAQLFFRDALFRQPPVGIPQARLEAKAELPSVTRELESLLEESERPDPSALMLRCSLIKTLVLVARAFRRAEGANFRLGFRPEVWAFLDWTERAIGSQEPLDLKAFASRCSMTRDHFSRLFRQATGIAPLAYCQRRRIQLACAQLLDPRRSATDIAYGLGFADSAHFSRAFRQQIGLAPSAYRKRFFPGAK